MISIRLEDPDGAALPAARPGQYLTLRIRPSEHGRCCATTRCRDRPAPAPTASPSSASPRASPAAICTPSSRSATSSTSPRRAAPSSSATRDAPVLLISAGIGATPVLAMLHALAQEHSEREIWWLHGARSRATTPSRPRRAGCSPRSPTSAPTSSTAARPGRRRPRLDRGPSHPSLLAELEPPRDAEAYLCGPVPFMEEISAALGALGLDASHVHTEPFGPAPGLDARHRGERPRGSRTRRPASPEAARRSSSRAATSRSRGARTTRACSSSPRPATCRPLVVPHRRLPQLRDDAHRRRRRLRPRPGRAARRRQRADLLLAPARRRRARPVTD